MRNFSIATLALLLCGCDTNTVPDDRPRFQIDRNAAFQIQFGRGSGLDGLEMVTIDQDGHVKLLRVQETVRGKLVERAWQSAELDLPAKALTQVLDAVKKHGLLGMHRQYNSDVRDGTQWVLWIQQGANNKSVYFNNHFPAAIRSFAKELDTTLDKAGQRTAKWKDVSWDEANVLQKDLWDSIR